MLQVDAGERGRELPQIGGRRADQAGELAEAPMRRRNRRIGTGQDQRQPLRIVAAGLDADQRAFDDAGPAALRAVLTAVRQVGERQIALVRRPGEPFRRHAADALAAADIHLVTAAASRRRIENLHLCHGSNLHDGRRRPLLQPSTRHGNPPALFLSRALRGPRRRGRPRRKAGRRGRLSPPGHLKVSDACVKKECGRTGAQSAISGRAIPR